MDPIDKYFSRFRDFQYKPSRDWRQLGPFNALAKHRHWDVNKKKKEFRRLQQAWTEAVESEFGGSTIDHYQSLCEDLEIDPIPETVTECKSELRAVFVNIVDLMQYRRNGRRGRKPELFGTVEELRIYSVAHKKFYSKENAKAEMLRELLKVLIS